MLPTARVPPTVLGEISRPSANLFGHELEQRWRRLFVLFQHPAGMAEIAEDEGETEASVWCSLANDQVEVIATECI